MAVYFFNMAVYFFNGVSQYINLNILGIANVLHLVRDSFHFLAQLARQGIQSKKAFIDLHDQFQEFIAQLA